MHGFQFGVIDCVQGLPDLLVAYAQAGHPCPTLLPLVSRAAEAAEASGVLSPRRLAWLRQSEARLLSLTKTEVVADGASLTLQES